MAEYRICFRCTVMKELKRVPKKSVKRILNRIKSLAFDPRPSGCEKLSGQGNYRIRDGNYRIVYSIQDKELTVWKIKIGQRRDVYRRM